MNVASTSASVVAAVLLMLHPAAAHAASSERIAYLAFTGDFWQVWTMAPDGGGARQVTRSPSDKARCSWFPDGKRLLLNTADGRLFTVDPATGKETPVAIRVAGEDRTSPLPGMIDAALSPDGRQIAFSLSLPNDRDNNEIWIAPVAGGDARRVTQGGGLHHEPAWAPDGQSLYYLHKTSDQEHDIIRVTLATGASETLTAGQLYHFDVAVSRAGDLAYASNRSGNYEIWVQRAGKGEPFRVTDDPAADGRPTWSPDGKALVFESSRGDGLQLWKVAVGESGPAGPPVQLTHHPRGARAPVWEAPPAAPRAQGKR